jgi:hypothetical protein
MVENISASLENIKESHSPVIKQKWRDLGVHNFIKVGIIAVLFCYLFQNEIRNIVRQWIEDSSWSHGFLIPLFSLYFINQHKKEIINLETKPSYLGLFFLIFGIVFYPLNVVHFQYGYLKPIDMIATLGAITLFLGGWRLVKYTWLPVAFLIFAVPLPQRMYVKLTMPMQMLAAQVAGALLNLVKGLGPVLQLAEGYTVDLPANVHHQLDVRTDPTWPTHWFVPRVTGAEIGRAHV